MESLESKEGVFLLQINGQIHAYDGVIVATGGSPKECGYAWWRTLGHGIVLPVPSLFTFNVPAEEKLKALSGTSVPIATVKFQGSKLQEEEFVTCGGVDLAEVDFHTMSSRKVPGLYFAGEVLDIDDITGGFNFQSAWSTGFLAGQLA